MALTVGEARNVKELVAACEALRKKRLEARRPFEELWWNNIALVSGDHYTEYDPQLATFVDLPKERHEVRLVLNQARVVLRTELAKLMKSRPIMEVVPNSMDEIDIAAARVGKFALDAAEFQFGLRRLRKRAQWWTGITGCCGVYVGYNPTDISPGYYEVVIDPNTNEPTFNKERIQQLTRMAQDGEIDDPQIERWPLGDLEFKLYTPFHMLPDDTVFDFEEIKDLILTDVIDLQQAKDTWPDAADRLSSQPGRPTIMNRMLARAGLITDASQYASEDTSEIYSYWLKPGVYDSKFLRQGVLLRWTNHDAALEFHDSFPFSDKRIPVSFFRHTENAIAIWPDTVMTDIRDVNLELDKTISLLLENRDYMVSPMWRKAKQSQVSKIKMAPGSELEYVFVRDVPPPEPIPGTPMPTQVENLVIGLRDQILDLSGQGEVSRGRLPSGVRSGVQMTYLQEEDETKLGPVADEWEAAIAKMGSMILSRFGQFYTQSRLMKSYQPGRQADVRKFKGADLKGNTDVRVQAGSGLPRMKAAKQQFALNLAELGIERDPKRLQDIFELGEGEPDEIDLAFAQADRENEAMRGLATIPIGGDRGSLTLGGGDEDPDNVGEAMAVPVKKWHNHDAHLKRHYRMMSTVEFEKLATTSPEIVRLFDEHTAVHEQEKARIQMEQLQMMIAAKGGPEATTPDAAAMPMDSSGEVARRRTT